MLEYWAHSENGNGSGVREYVHTHLRAVADPASRFASNFGAADQGCLIGLLHDLGKYADQFKKRIEDENEPGRDHSSVGALLTAQLYGRLGVVPALAIEGHHIGLTRLPGVDSLPERIAKAMISNPDAFTSTDVKQLLERFRQDGFELPATLSGLILSDEHTAADMLDVRMLFSALVDADFLATEEHFAGNAVTLRRPRPNGPALDARKAFDVVAARVRALSTQARVDSAVREMRESLFQTCLNTARQPQGIFTLSAPTGSGKTLAILAFALQHAITHSHLHRVILVMPFLNIIEQTAAIYRGLFSPEHGFPEHFVIEDHSNVQSDPYRSSEPNDAKDEREHLGRLLAENWDAPIILTTSVQCLESLMANRPGASRKLHRLANSVILFDEVQTLPPHLAVPTLATLSRLCERFGATVVFATATQPAFDHLDEKVRELAAAGWRPREITADIQKTQFAVAGRRIRVNWRTDEPVSWDTIADELATQDQVLCVVNLKRHARGLTEHLRSRQAQGTLHLSTNMCPAHRTRVLSRVRDALSSRQPVRLIATQCVEAGVDLDFPVVYRALGPLEAIAQAAGRCNRHGTRMSPGAVRVFLPQPDGKCQYPGGAYRQAAESTMTYLRGLAEPDGDLDQLEILNDPARLRAYYRQFYALTRAADLRGGLEEALTAGDFGEIARQYRLIEGNAINIVVPYHRAVFDALRAEPEHGFESIEAIRDWIRRARAHAVSIYRPDPGRGLPSIFGYIEPVQFSRRKRADSDGSDWFVLLDEKRYDTELLGLVEGEDSWVI